ncbi:MAG: hypothetical protein ACREM3_19815 [Candidatus Rokuibacteriota bacterium]
MTDVAARDPFRIAACAYLVYGIVYLIGGLYLVSHGVGVAGGRTSGAIGPAMLRWGLIGAIPLIGIPLLLSRPWSRLGGWVSRRTFAWLVSLLLALRAFKVGEFALRGGAGVPAPWGGEISFRAGATVFLVVTLMALGFVLRAAWMGDGAPAAPRAPRR